MPPVSGKAMLSNALREGYAVGAFNAYNMEMAQAIVAAAEEERSPVIVQVSGGTIQHAGLEVATALVKTLALGASMPVVLHLDHGTDFAVNMNCLRMGFTSLMYDGSEALLKAYKEETGDRKPPFDAVVDMIQSRRAFEENLRVTRQVVEAAHACGVPVEAELGKIPRIEEFGAIAFPEQGGRLSPEVRAMVERLCANAEAAAEFVRLSGCDSLAVACGSVHGMKDAVQPLNVKLIGEIAAKCGIPLVLHGSSGVIRSRKEALSRGLPLEEREGGIEEGIQSGIAKVNVSTELQVTYLEALGRILGAEPGAKDVRKVCRYAREALKDKVKSFMRLFGSSGKGDSA